MKMYKINLFIKTIDIDYEMWINIPCFRN